MRNKWFISSVAVATIGSSLYFFRKIRGSKTNSEELYRTELITYFESKGYKVHCYNENNDFILFHQSKNEKKHVFYDNGEVSPLDFHKKMEFYYYNFTNSFHFISVNKQQLKEIQNTYQEWSLSLDFETVAKYGNPQASFQTVYTVLNDLDENWNY